MRSVRVKTRETGTVRGAATGPHFSLAIISVTVQLRIQVFWVISVYFNVRNILPKSGTFHPGHPVQGDRIQEESGDNIGHCEREVHMNEHVSNCEWLLDTAQNMWASDVTMRSANKCGWCRTLSVKCLSPGCLLTFVLTTSISAGKFTPPVAQGDQHLREIRRD